MTKNNNNNNNTGGMSLVPAPRGPRREDRVNPGAGWAAVPGADQVSPLGWPRVMASWEGLTRLPKEGWPSPGGKWGRRQLRAGR